MRNIASHFIVNNYALHKSQIIYLLHLYRVYTCIHISPMIQIQDMIT